MTDAITLDGMEPVGDEPPRNAVIIYPSDTPRSVVLVSYDHEGHEVARERVIRAQLTMAKLHSMMWPLLSVTSLSWVAVSSSPC